MKLIGFILAACIALAVLRVALAVMFVMMILGIIAGLFFRPVESLGFLGFLLLASLANEHGGALLLVIGLAVISTTIVPRRE